MAMWKPPSLCWKWLAVAALLTGPYVGVRADSFADLPWLEEQYNRYWDVDDFVRAEPIARRGYRIVERSAATRPADVADWALRVGAVLLMKGEYLEAEKLFRQCLQLRERLYERDGAETTPVVMNLGRTYYELGRYAEADRFLRRALAANARLYGPQSAAVTQSLLYLGFIAEDQGRYEDAEAVYRRVLDIRQREFGPVHSDVAGALNNLGNIYHHQLRLPAAEAYFKRSVEIYEQLGKENFELATSLNNLANVYLDQGRADESEALLRRALAIREKTLGPASPKVAVALSSLAHRLNERERYAEAEPLLKRALAIYGKVPIENNPDVCYPLINLANIYSETGRVAEAGPLYLRSLEIREKVFGPDHVDCANSLINLADFYRQTRRLRDALARIDRAIAIFEKSGLYRNRYFTAMKLRARIEWEAGDKKAALADVGKAMDLAESLREESSNNERDRASAFGEYLKAFESAVAWQVELGDPAEAFAAAERSRARSLIEQMRLGGVSLLASLPPQAAEEFRRRQLENQSTIASLQRQVSLLEDRKDLSVDDRKKQIEALEGPLNKARGESAEIYREMRNASPALKLSSGRNLQSIGTTDLSAFLARNTGVMLYYMIGADHGFVFVLTPNGAPKAVPLAVDDALARRLGVQAGPLTAERLRSVLTAGGVDVVAQLGRPQSEPAVAERLALLCKLLIPTAERTALADGTYQRLYVSPDAGLAGLPFETLIVQPGAEPKYLLDVGPPIAYVPSAAVLLNLAKLPGSAGSTREPLLTVADPAYGGSTDSNAGFSASAMYGSVSGSLQALPFTRTESTWVAANFEEIGWKAASLVQAKATEANVRASVSGRNIIHLACHGLADQRYGNLFGALALTPGPQPGDADDDGFLTLPEIYELNLKGTELAILSACQTNYGPQQRGEGVWALSRGFIVAGARRVVASNWFVDDEAGSSLVSYFSAVLADMEKKTPGQVDYASALQQAQRWARAQSKWSSPYYWSAFVLLGPN